jgi:hypothetical protein
MAKSFDASRLMKFSRVIQMEGERQTQIAYHEKEVWNIYELFHSRYNLHKRAYTHRVSCILEAMYGDVLELAEPHLTVPGRGGRPVRIGDAIHDMRAYTALTDHILKRIEFSTADALQPARSMLRRIQRRELHIFVGEQLLRPGAAPKDRSERVAGVRRFLVAAAASERAETERAEASADAENARGENARGENAREGPHDAPAEVRAARCGPRLRPEDLVVKLVSINYGMKDKNPVDFVHFYRRKSKSFCTQYSKAGDLAERERRETEATGFRIHADSVSCLVPHVFQEEYVRVYCKSRDARTVDLAVRAFKTWCER